MAKPKLKDQRPDYEIDNAAIADRMREAVEQCEDYGTTEIAQFCGVNRTLVYEWMRAAGSRPSVENMTKFCKAVGVDFEWIMFGVEDTRPFAHTRTEDENVVHFERPIVDARGAPDAQSLVTSYIGIYELDEVQEKIKEDPSKFRDLVQGFKTAPKDRTSLAITLNPNKLHVPGIPKFAFQFLIDGTPFTRGTYIAYANDIAPARGKFCIFAVKRKGEKEFKFANGHYYPVNDRLLSSNISEGYKGEANRGFVLKLDPNKDSPDDTYLMPDDFEKGRWSQDCRLVGVATYIQQWLDVVQMHHHTGLIERLDRVYEGRRFEYDPDL